MSIFCPVTLVNRDSAGGFLRRYGEESGAGAREMHADGAHLQQVPACRAQPRVGGKGNILESVEEARGVNLAA